MVYAADFTPMPISIGGGAERSGLGVVVDSVVVEMMSTFVLCFASVACWCQAGFVPPNDWSEEFILPTAVALVVMCIQDRDEVFADSSPFVTLLEMAMGAYETWTEVFWRLVGQSIGAGLAIAVVYCPGRFSFHAKVPSESDAFTPRPIRI